MREASDPGDIDWRQERKKKKKAGYGGGNGKTEIEVYSLTQLEVPNLLKGFIQNKRALTGFASLQCNF